MLTIFNDLHIGAIRSGGTTPATALKLRQALLMSFDSLLQAVDNDVLINGDLLDTSSIPMSDLLTVYRILLTWLAKGHKLYLSAGNHDQSKSSMHYSSFRFLCQILESDQVIAIEAPTAIPEHSAYVVPHLANQDLFDMALDQVPTCRYLFLHVNYDNKFAMQSDHSLNLTPKQASDLPCEFIVLGHEHQHKIALGGKVIIVGNQIPSSVSDCLGNSVKYCLNVDDHNIHQIPVWLAEGSFSEQDWKSLEDKGDFIRVVGEATAEEASKVVAAISKFRNSARALVITNAVNIAGQNPQQIAANLEDVRSFSVLDALMDILEEPERVVIKKLLENHSV